VSRDQAITEIAAVNVALADGFYPEGSNIPGRKRCAIRLAAERLGTHGTAFKSRVGTPNTIGKWEEDYGLTPDWSLIGSKNQESLFETLETPFAKTWTTGLYSQAKAKSVGYSFGTPKHAYFDLSAPSKDSKLVRVLAIGDVHAKPGRSVDHLVHVGKHAAATQPDYLVSIGDFLSLDSLSDHPAKGSGKDSNRPAFGDDLRAGDVALEALTRYVPAETERVITLGNHCQRAWRAADQDPRRSGDMPERLNALFNSYGFETHEFGKWYYIGNVGFTHVPMNFMGKPYGGKNSENMIGNDAVHDVVWGHDHKGRVKTVAKMGQRDGKPNHITMVNLGTCMPYGEVEDYSIGVTGWTYQIYDLTIRDGSLISARPYNLLELEEMYG
jgi:hypothetical protein